jgi:hypothetical protein
LTAGMTMSRAMLRRLLTYLAVLTGLAAVGAAPIHAQAGEADVARLEAGLEQLAHAAAAPITVSHAEAGRAALVPAPIAPLSASSDVLRSVPGVRLGSDRARE